MRFGRGYEASVLRLHARLGLTMLISRVAFAGFCCLPALGAAAQAGREPLLEVADADPLALAAVADRMGDDAVLARLEAGTPIALRLAAVRATPFLREPELALLPLARIAVQRDPDLAPAAARRAFAIAQALQLEARQAGELSVAALVPARDALRAAGTTASVRADLRLLLTQAAWLLDALGVPTATSVAPAGHAP